MKRKGVLIGIVAFLSVLLVLAGIWLAMDEKRANLAEKYIKKGESLEKNQNYKGAYFEYKKAQMATPRSFAPYYKQGLLYKQVGQTDSAIDNFKQSIQFARQEMAPTYALAKTYYENKDYGKAEKYFQHCFAFEPTNSELYFWLGKSQMNQERLDEAEDSFRIALETFPSSDYHLYLGLVLAYKDVENGYQQIKEYQANKGFSFADFDTKTVLAAESEREKQIQESFDRMLNTESEPTKKLLLGQLLNYVGESGLATKKLTQLTEDYPDMRDGWLALAHGQIQEKQTNKAIESLNKAKQIDPSYSLTYKLLSKAYQAQGNQAQAKEMQLKANMLKEG